MLKKYKAFTVIEVLATILLLAMITITSHSRIGSVLDKPKDLEITRDLKQYEDVAIVLTAQGREFTEDNINKQLGSELQLTGGVSNSNNPYGEPYSLEIVDKDTFKVTSIMYKNGEPSESKVLTVTRVNGKVFSSYEPAPLPPKKPQYEVGALVMEINIPSDNTQFVFPAYGPFNLEIDWGDGTSKTTLTEATTNRIQIPHSYETPGTYTVKVKGNCERFSYDGITSRIYLKEVDQLGNISKNYVRSFKDCINLEDITGVTLNGTGVSDISRMFEGCLNIKGIPSFFLSGVNITGASYTFYNCSSIKEFPADALNGCLGFVGNDMAPWLQGTNIEVIDQNALRGFSGDNIKALFMGCNKLKEVPEGIFKGTDIRYFNYVFSGCTNLQRVPSFLFKDLSIESNVYMFKDCVNLKSLPADLFNGCVKFTTNDFYPWLYGSGIESIDSDIFNGYLGDSVNAVFKDCSKLKSIPGDLFKDTNIVRFNHTFEKCTSITEIPPYLFDGISVKESAYMFRDCSGVTSLPADLFNGCEEFSANEFYAWLYNTNVNSIDEDLFRGFKGVSARAIFKDCSKLVNIPETLFQGTNITNFNMTFQNCTSITEIPPYLFKGLTVTQMAHTFYQCTGIINFPADVLNGCISVSFNGIYPWLEGTNIVSIDPDALRGYLGTSTNEMFMRCKKLTNIPSTIFENTNITSVVRMFAGCNAITIVPEFWNNLSLVNNLDCFEGCTLASNYASIPANWK